MSNPEEDDGKQSREWGELYERIRELLAGYGIDNAFGAGDYFVVDTNYGWYRHHIEVQKLDMFRPEIVAELRSLLNNYSAWTIVLQIAVPGKEEVWRKMGLTIRKHEIIEVLRRSVLPPEFQQWKYAGGRPGTEYD